MINHRREHLQLLLSLPLVASLGGCAARKHHENTSLPSELPLNTVYGNFNAIVDPGITSESPKRSEHPATFSTLQDAINAAPANSTGAWRIAVRDGRYREKIEITKPNIQLFGESRNKTIVTFDAYAGQQRPDKGGTWTTFGCATLIVRSPGFRAENLTIANGFDYLTNDAKSPTDPSYTNDPQAVALMLAKGSDRAHLQNVSLVGYQDTLFVDAGRSFFSKCTVSGNVDFIFGAGQAYFEECEIVSRERRKPNVNPHGYITAPSTQISDHYGLVFSRCKLLRENEFVPPKSHALGRPWHPAANFPDGRYADPNAIGSSVFLNCFMDEHIHPNGWWSMTGLQKSGPHRTVFLPEDSRFFEYQSYGPGAPQTPAAIRRQLTSQEADLYALNRILGGWNPRQES